MTSAAFRVRVCVVVWNESHLNEVRFFRGPFIPVSDLYTYVVAWQSLCLFLCLWQDSNQAERPVLLTNSWKVSKLKQLEAIFWISNRHSILQSRLLHRGLSVPLHADASLLSWVKMQRLVLLFLTVCTERTKKDDCFFLFLSCLGVKQHLCVTGKAARLYLLLLVPFQHTAWSLVT